MKIPVIKGNIEVIPIVLKAFSEVPSGDKKRIRRLLQEIFTEEFIDNISGKKVTRKGRELRTDEEVKDHLEKTWLDCYALPLCERFKLIFRNDKYLLTAYGEKLRDALERSHQEYLDMLASFLIKQDSEEWKVLESLYDLNMADIKTLIKSLKNKGVHVSKAIHLVSLLKIFKCVGLVESEKGLYKINKEKFLDLSSRKYFREYDEVSDQEFFDVLYDFYAQKTKETWSDYIAIDQLRGPVCKKLNWPWEYFDKRLSEMPLMMGDKQILFSPSAFIKKGGIYRMGQYYMFLSIYNKRTGKFL